MLTVVGYQKALKMIKSELFRLSKPTVDNKNKLDKKLIINLKKEIYKVIKNFNAILIQSCDVFENFTGRDIDALYNKKKYSYKLNNDTIIRNLNDVSLRIHLNHNKNINFLSLDVESISAMPKKIRSIFKKVFDNKIYCNHTKLNHLDQKSIIFYKLIKYFYYGTIHSYNQLLYLKKDIKNLNKTDINQIKNSIEELFPNEKDTIKKFLLWEFNKFYKNNDIKKFLLNKRLERHKKRRVFSGKLNFNRVFFSKKFLYALLFGSRAIWKHSHNSMPAITIIGNDGSGKTTVVEHIREKFSKMDPLIFDMKASVPFFSITHKIRNFLKKIKKSVLVKKIHFFNTIISIIGEIIDLFDKYIKFKIGMAWADSGNGLTVFERFPTDRIRGEFPNKNNKLLPLEQFFPFPDGMIYLDVMPKDSIIRKKKDKHTLCEMKSKRKNYLTLIEEFDEVEFLPSSKNMNDKILKIKNYIFKLNKKKNFQIKKNGKVKRVYWKKNFNRVLAGNNLNKTQKEGFFE
jgi:thymidylate kinase